MTKLIPGKLYEIPYGTTYYIENYISPHYYIGNIHVRIVDIIRVSNLAIYLSKVEGSDSKFTNYTFNRKYTFNKLLIKTNIIYVHDSWDHLYKQLV